MSGLGGWRWFPRWAGGLCVLLISASVSGAQSQEQHPRRVQDAPLAAQAGSAGRSATSEASDEQDRDDSRRHDLRHRDGRRGRRGRGWDGPLGGFMPGPTPADRRPVTEGETAELLATAETHFPRLHELLTRIRERRGEPAFRRALQRTAPRLRHLRRVFERNPELGEILVSHAKNEHFLRRALRGLRRVDTDAQRAELTREIRERIAENLTLQEQAFEIRLDELRSDREAVVAERLDHVLAKDPPRAERLPPPVRRLVWAYHAAQSEDQRDALRAELRELFGGMIDQRLMAMEQRLERIRADATGEVDARLDRLLERAERFHGQRDRRDRARRERDEEADEVPDRD